MFGHRFTRSGKRPSKISVAMLFPLCASLQAVGQDLKEFDTDYLQSPAGAPQLAQAEEVIVRRTNEFRQAQGLAELNTDERLQKAAGYFAAYMARTNNYGHGADGNRPSERVSLFDYDYCLVAENIAYQRKSTGFETKELAEKFFDGWKDSPEHRENMLQPHVTETGVAIGHAPDSDRYFAVQLFGRPRGAATRFQVSNRTEDSIRYVVDVAGDDAPEARRRAFDLPPRATMFHTRCRPATIDWSWTDREEALQPSNNRAYVITATANGYRVAEQPASQ